MLSSVYDYWLNDINFQVRMTVVHTHTVHLSDLRETTMMCWARVVCYPDEIDCDDKHIKD